MIINEKQLMFLHQVLLDSLCICGASSPFVFSQESRRSMAEEIFKQQSDKLKEIE